eukprot:9322530-Alexandrium_andersonii.AAC.2
MAGRGAVGWICEIASRRAASWSTERAGGGTRGAAGLKLVRARAIEPTGRGQETVGAALAERGIGGSETG